MTYGNPTRQKSEKPAPCGCGSATASRDYRAATARERSLLWGVPIILLLAGVLHAAVIDRVAVIVGKRVVKASDLDRDLRVSQFLNHQPLDLSSATKRKVAERLIDQELVRQELLNGRYAGPTEEEANTYLQQLSRDRFKGSPTQLRTELSRYGLSEDQLRRRLLWQLTVLRFIDQRFRPGVLVTDEDVSEYYQAHRAELQKASPRNSSLEAVEPRIREILTGERVNQMFEEWLREARKNMRVEYREAAFAEESSQ